MNSTVIHTVSNITLVTLQDASAKVEVISEVFERIAKRKINIDMISMAPTHGAVTGLSFTISDNDLIDVLGFTAELKRDMNVNVIVSSVNHKISVFDPAMKNTPGIASKVFSSISATDADIRLITTSEVEISLLVTEADYDTVLTALEKTFG